MDEKHDDRDVVSDSDLESSDDEVCDEGSGGFHEKNGTFMVCVGMQTTCKRFTGNKLVDSIMKLEKRVKYLPKDMKCFNQWICLREIHCDLKSQHGGVRCAIQVSAFPKEDDEWYREDWGWNEKYRGSWVAFEIVKVKLFPCVIFSQQAVMGSTP